MALSCAWAVLLRWMVSVAAPPGDCCFGAGAFLLSPAAGAAGATGCATAAAVMELTISVTSFFCSLFHIGWQARIFEQIVGAVCFFGAAGGSGERLSWCTSSASVIIWGRA